MLCPNGKRALEAEVPGAITVPACYSWAWISHVERLLWNAKPMLWSDRQNTCFVFLCLGHFLSHLRCFVCLFVFGEIKFLRRDGNKPFPCTGHTLIISFIIYLFLKVFIFIFEREYVSRGEEEREKESESQAGSTLRAEPDAGLDPTTPGSWPELKSRVRRSTKWAPPRRPCII